MLTLEQVRGSKAELGIVFPVLPFSPNLLGKGYM